MGFNPLYFFGNEQGTGVSKLYKIILLLGLLEIIIILCQTDNYAFLFSYVTLEFHKILCVSYQMAMMTSAPTFSWNLSYQMAYNEPT